jgi:hypothetical protein
MSVLALALLSFDDLVTHLEHEKDTLLSILTKASVEEIAFLIEEFA